MTDRRSPIELRWCRLIEMTCVSRQR